MGVLLFLSTLSFLFTMRGVTAASVGGDAVLSVLPTQFLFMLWAGPEVVGPAPRRSCRRPQRRLER